MAEYEEARLLRRRGWPMKQIADYLGVSPGTVHRWTNDIELTPEQRARIADADADRWRRVVERRARSWSARCRQIRTGYQRAGRRRAREGDGLHQAGCMLYWAEGAKNRNTVAFSNSDRGMVTYFKRFLDQEFNLPPERYSVSLNVYLGNGPTLGEIEASWLADLELPSSCTRKHTLNHMPTSSSGKKRNKLPYGVCTLRVLRSTPVVQHIFGAIQEYAGFEGPAWLD